VATGFAAIIGHCFSPFLRGHGGKGVATALGVFLALDPLLALGGIAVWGLVFAVTRVPALGSLAAAFSIGPALVGLRRPPPPPPRPAPWRRRLFVPPPPPTRGRLTVPRRPAPPPGCRRAARPRRAPPPPRSTPRPPDRSPAAARTCARRSADAAR